MRVEGRLQGSHDATRAFAFFTAADPARVWLALTDETQTREYLYGLALSSEWTDNAHVFVSFRKDVALTGRVLHVTPLQRLSYLLRAPDAPPVYLTWLIRPGPGGTICSLQVDEVDSASSPAEIEDTWLPILDALRRLLAAD